MSERWGRGLTVERSRARRQAAADHLLTGWLSQQAQWWVETLEKIRILESTLDDHTIDRHRATVEETEAGTADVESSQQQPASAQSVQKESQPDAIAQ